MMKMEYKLTPEQRELISRRTKEAMAKPEIRLKLCLLNSRARKRVKRRKDYLRNQAMKQENKRREEEKLSEVEKRCLLYDINTICSASEQMVKRPQGGLGSLDPRWIGQRKSLTLR